MSDSKQPKYPDMKIELLWNLRPILRRVKPPVFSTGYLEDLLDISEPEAWEVQKHLMRLWLVDENTDPTERFFRWIRDDDYAEVCHLIRHEI